MPRWSKNTKVELLRSVSLFGSCTNKELQSIAGLADEVEVPAGYVLTKEGQPGAEFFIVVEGKAKASLRAKLLSTYGPGDFFGEMALLERQPRAATITAQTPMKLLVLSHATFWRFLREAPTVALNMLKGVAHRLREFEKAPTY